MRASKVNIQSYFMLIVFCFVVGHIQQIINNFSGVLGWIFIIFTAGVFFYAGGNLVDQGFFTTKKWKAFFVLLLPIVFFADVYLIYISPWYHGSSGFAYYTLYTISFLFKRLPKSDWVQISNSSSYNNLSMGFIDKTIDGTNFVSIGNQIWMAENLNVNTFINGDKIKEAKTAEEWDKACKNREPAWCYYENNPVYSDVFGKLYNWFALNDPRGLTGMTWRIPSYDDWWQLAYFLGGNHSAGKYLKSQTKWINNGNGTNESGFNAFPGGYRHLSLFCDIGKRGYWWTSTQTSSKNAKCLIMGYSGNYVDTFNKEKRMGLSVRCIMNTYH